MIDLSIIIVTYNSEKLILKCLDSIKKYTQELNYEVIVVDNNSADGTVAALRKFQIEYVSSRRANFKFQVITNKENRGFAAANNQGIKKAQGRYVLLLNPDTKLIEDSLLVMVMWMDKHPKVGISSCKLINKDGSVQTTGGYFPTLPKIFLWATFLDDMGLDLIVGSYHPHARFYKKERDLDWVTGAFFLIRKEVVEQISLMDEDFFLYVEEVEYCFRAKKKGWKIWYFPGTSVLHYQGASGTKEGTILREFRGLQLFYSKHFPAWQGIILKFLLYSASILRIVIFAVTNPEKGGMYVKALAKI